MINNESLMRTLKYETSKSNNVRFSTFERHWITTNIPPDGEWIVLLCKQINRKGLCTLPVESASKRASFRAWQNSRWRRWCRTRGPWRIACTCRPECPTAWTWRHKLRTQRSWSLGWETNSSRPPCGRWSWWPAGLFLCPTMHCEKGGRG